MENLHYMCVNFYIQYYRAIHRCCDIRAQVNQPIGAESMFQSKNNSTQEVLCQTKQWYHRSKPKCQCLRYIYVRNLLNDISVFIPPLDESGGI